MTWFSALSMVSKPLSARTIASLSVMAWGCSPFGSASYSFDASKPGEASALAGKVNDKLPCLSISTSSTRKASFQRGICKMHGQRAFADSAFWFATAKIFMFGVLSGSLR